MTDIELSTICFFAGVDEWLSERCVRFADIWNDVVEETEVHCEPVKQNLHSLPHIKAGDTSPDDFCDVSPVAAAHKSGGSPRGGLERLGDSEEPLEAVPESVPAEILALQNEILNAAPPPLAPGQRKNSAAERHAKAAAAAAAAAAMAAAKAVPPVVTINAAKLLEVVSPMGMVNRPTEDEVEQMYSLLLGGSTEKEHKDKPPGAHKQTLGIAVFQMDKILRTAKRNFDKARQACTPLLRTDKELPPTDWTKECVVFLGDLNMALLERSGFMGITEDFLDDCGYEFSVWKLIEKAEMLGIDFNAVDKDENRRYPEDMEKFCAVLADQIVPGCGADGMMQAGQVYRALALVQEGRQCQRRFESGPQGALRCLAGPSMTHHDAPTTFFFGLAAFVECLLKLALHRLGGKGSNEIQRGSPAWWKCAWLIALLSGEFKDHIKRYNHEQQIRSQADSLADGGLSDDDLAKADAVPDRNVKLINHPATKKMQERPGVKSPSPNHLSPRESQRNSVSPEQLRGRSSISTSEKSDPASNQRRNDGPQVQSPKRRHTALGSSISSALLGKAEYFQKKRQSAAERRTHELDTWYARSFADQMPRYVPPLEYLVHNMPELFDASTGECCVPSKDTSPWPAACERCNEMASPSGWGTPGCALCSGVEELCLPITKHLFGSLLKTPRSDRVALPVGASAYHSMASHDQGSNDEEYESRRPSLVQETSRPASVAPESRRGSKVRHEP